MTFRTLRRALTWSALAAAPWAASAACDKSDPPPRTQTPAGNGSTAGGQSGTGTDTTGGTGTGGAPTAQSLSGQSSLGSAVRSAEKLKSAAVMREILTAQVLAKNSTGKWPAKLPDGVSVANPWTETDPGYEWVPPPNNAPADARTVVLYQLKDGKRVTGAQTGRADGSVRDPNE